MTLVKTLAIQAVAVLLMLICCIVSIHYGQALLAALNGANIALLTVSTMLSYQRLKKGKNNGE
jgi:hypothetical protein